MREIKFRAWHKKWNLTITEIGLGDSEVTFPIGNSSDVLEVNEEYHNLEFMQYTGLKDKNGQEIYEGDIIRTVKPGEHVPNRDSGGGIVDYDYIEPEEKFCYVEFFAATFATKETKFKDSENYYAPLDWIIHDEQVEVIGNIYEHPHLMEQSS